jgi:AraC-like DNA-binding protein
MRQIAPILLVRQTIVQPMLDVLDDAGAPTARLLRETGLPESLQEREDGFLPFGSLLSFVGHSARSQDIPDLCWRGLLRARTRPSGGWSEAVSRCTTLRSAILTFCDSFVRDIPFMKLGLEVGDEYAWFWRRRPAEMIDWPGNDEGQQFALAAMIRIVRAAAGPRWVPPHVLLESATAPWLSEVPELVRCEIDLRCPMVAIAVPYELLGRSIRWTGGAEKPDPPKLLTAEQTLAGSLRQAFASLLPAVRPSLEAAAELADLTPRTLRRRLDEEGTSWRKVVDGARLEACFRLLQDPERPLAQIAAELGYSDQTNLTHAFRRWTGECPRAYRRRWS